MFERQQRAIQAVQAATRRAHDTAQVAKAAPAPTSEAQTESRRNSAIAERFHAAPQRGPRIRGL
jgi:hypothetical protein